MNAAQFHKISGIKLKKICKKLNSMIQQAGEISDLKPSPEHQDQKNIVKWKVLTL